MQSRQVIFAALAAGVLAGAVGFAQNGTPINPHSNNALTVAVYGDLPYGLTPRRYDTDRQDPGLHLDDQRRSASRSRPPRGRHSFRQAVLHGSLRPADLRLLDHLQEPGHLHARRQRMERLPQDGRGWSCA